MFRVGFGGWPQIQALNNRDAMINLASEMSTVDDGVGRVMAALSKYGFDANTLVVLTSDQGSLYGQHGLWGNTSAWWPPSVYDENMRVPLIFRHPNKIKAGTTTLRLANQFDFLPSVLDYLGFADRKISQGAGQSYAAALTGSESGTEQSDVFFEFMTVRAIRTEQWLYQKSFLLGDDALFDLQADPEQRHNRVDDSDFAKVVKMLDTRLTEFFARTADPRYDLWQGGTAKLKLFDGGDNKVFAEKFPGWQPPALGSSKASSAIDSDITCASGGNRNIRVPGRIGGRSLAPDYRIDQKRPALSRDGDGTLDGCLDLVWRRYLLPLDIKTLGDADVIDVRITEIATHVLPVFLVLHLGEHMQATAFTVVTAIVEDHDYHGNIIAGCGP